MEPTENRVAKVSGLTGRQETTPNLSWNKLIRPLFFQLSAETAHYTAMNAYTSLVALPLVASQMRRRYIVKDPRLVTNCFGLQFPNPVGLAAGFDKAGQWHTELAHLGFGCIEIGTVTGQAQPGNPKPRLFRSPADKAIINRMGFNSDGCEFVASQLEKKHAAKDSSCVLGINIGKSKVVPLEEAPAEYKKSFEQLFPFADYFTINVSSPNTPNLRELQNRDHLVDIITTIQQSNEDMAINTNQKPKPVLLKIAPDLTDQQLAEIAEVAIEYSLSGVIATNTTISREGLQTSHDKVEEIGAGGLSGKPLTLRSREVVANLYRNLRGKIPIVGVGGISNGPDAWNMICAGASLVQLYTGFIYGGPSIVHEINRHILSELGKHGFENLSQAVGTVHPGQ